MSFKFWLGALQSWLKGRWLYKCFKWTNKQTNTHTAMEDLCPGSMEQNLLRHQAVPLRLSLAIELAVIEQSDCPAFKLLSSLTKHKALNIFHALDYQMFFALSRNGTLFIFITASYENVSSIHGLHSQCLTWTCCMKSQSCVHKCNIFFPFTATQWPILQTAMFVYWFKLFLFSIHPIHLAYLTWSHGYLI